MMKFFSAFLLALFMSNTVLVNGHVLEAFNTTTQRRAAATCADPTLTDIYVESYSPSGKYHLLQMRTEFVDSLTVGNGDYGFQENIFRAWKDPQPFTFPLHRLFNAATQDYIFVLSTDGTAPSVPGYANNFIPAYMYSTQICDSIPLYSVARASATDHFYTTVLSERDDMINRWGWTDSGIIGYVLPLTPAAALEVDMFALAHADDEVGR